ncbi:hypothetical protein ACFWUZ_06455 [Streptomyces sp. NPDC058646]|uniref:hypothetical protein n=1 Tax=Streptomyces sp. NPDC058646 TaxID=3346574 RepID=UPI00364719FC
MAAVTATLSTNMAAVGGDFSLEGIRKLGNPVPMLVDNYWLRPGEAFVVTSYGTWGDRPFEVAHEPGRIEVWAASCFATVTFPDGTEVPGAHQRPPGI